MKNKENTKRKLINALGELIRMEGFDSLSASMDVSEICYTLFRGKLTTCFAGKEVQLML